MAELTVIELTRKLMQLPPDGIVKVQLHQSENGEPKETTLLVEMETWEDNDHLAWPVARRNDLWVWTGFETKERAS